MHTLLGINKKIFRNNTTEKHICDVNAVIPSRKGTGLTLCMEIFSRKNTGCNRPSSKAF